MQPYRQDLQAPPNASGNAVRMKRNEQWRCLMLSQCHHCASSGGNDPYNSCDSCCLRAARRAWAYCRPVAIDDSESLAVLCFASSATTSKIATTRQAEICSTCAEHTAVSQSSRLDVR
ncbi:hypothetical protein MRB53_038916 [Persea americana]|nr:hypothetical protein MRB53_038916 [Persea americana]